MARFRWFDGNGGTDALEALGTADLVRVRRNKVELEATGAAAGEAARIKVVLKPGRGGDEPQLAKIAFYDAEGEKVLMIDRIGLPAGDFVAALGAGDGVAARDYLAAGGPHTFVGASSSDDDDDDDSDAAEEEVDRLEDAWDRWRDAEEEAREAAEEEAEEAAERAEEVAEEAIERLEAAFEDLLDRQEALIRTDADEEVFETLETAFDTYMDAVETGGSAEETAKSRLKAAWGDWQDLTGQTERLGDGDLMTTSSFDDRVVAGAGDDILSDGGGSDVYKGGRGSDWLSYAEWGRGDGADGGIAAHLGKGRVRGPDGERDKLKSIENLQGSQFADKLVGDSGGNFFEGLGGRDTVKGKGGFDTVSFASDADWGGDGGVEVNLTRGRADDGFGSRDRLKSIEAAIGGSGDDRLRDGRGDNRLEGGDGDDRLIFGRGDDAGEGGLGADTFVFKGRKTGDDTIEDFQLGIDTLRIGPAGRGGIDLSREGDDLVLEFGPDSIVLLGLGREGANLDDLGL